MNALLASLFAIFPMCVDSETRVMPIDNAHPQTKEKHYDSIYTNDDLNAIFNDLKERSFAAIRDKTELVLKDMESLGYASPFSLDLYIDINRINEYKWPKEAVTGLFAHELGHIASYETRSYLNRMLFIWNFYLSDAARREVEREADMIAIKEGYGKELVLTRTLAIRDYDDKRVRKMRDVYYWPEELEDIISSMK